MLSSTAARSEGGRELTDLLPVVLFVLGAAMIAFSYGVMVGTYKLHPYEVLREAYAAPRALQDKYALRPEPHASVVDRDRAGVTLYKPDQAPAACVNGSGQREGDW